MYGKLRLGMETIIAISAVFQFGKTTIPKGVREKLELKDGDKILWHINEDNNIIISKRQTL
jgi:AbrB family looped-hinge helix DNA binding protein